MEITLDVGANIYQSLTQFAEKEGKDFELFALDMLELGLRVQVANQEAGDSERPKFDITDVMLAIVETRYQTEDILRMVFDKQRSHYKLYNSDATLSAIREKSLGFQDGLKI